MKAFTITTAIGALFVGGLAVTHIAFAQGEDTAHMRGGPMQMADTNKDGVLTRAELTATLSQRFAAMDPDGDGKITPEERQAARQTRFDAMFAKMDTDGNGQISKAEMQAAHEARMADRKADGGKDGPGGRHGPHRMGMMGGHDGPPPGGSGMGGPDGDGTLTREAFMARPLAMFDRMDMNKDGKVTKEERDAARAAMKARFRDRGDMPPPPPAGT